MRKVTHRLFWIWDFEKEEKWLNQMAARGLALVSVSLFCYEFENCAPGEYQVCMEFLENDRLQNEQYINFLEDTGIQHVGTFHRWAYFRKKTADGTFRLFSDYTSRIQYLTRLIRFIALIGGFNLYVGCYNLFLYLCPEPHRPISLWGIINGLLSALCAGVIFGLLQKRKRLQADGQIFE